MVYVLVRRQRERERKKTEEERLRRRKEGGREREREKERPEVGKNVSQTSSKVCRINTFTLTTSKVTIFHI